MHNVKGVKAEYEAFADFLVLVDHCVAPTLLFSSHGMIPKASRSTEGWS